MNEVARLALLVGLAGVVLTLLGLVSVWFSNEERRIRRGLTKVLGEAPHADLIAPGRGRGVGFNFTDNILAVCWDAGAWCLIYRVDELIGAELIVDGQVMARVHRGEARRALDARGGAEKAICLRLVFDDPAHPDFELELWSAAVDSGRKGGFTPADALQEANRWVARTESLLRRPVMRRDAFNTAPVVQAPPEPGPAVRPTPVSMAPAPLFDDLDDDDPPFAMDPPPRDDDDEGVVR